MRFNKFLFAFITITSLINISNFAQENNDQVAKEINKILEDEYFQSTTLAVSIFDLTSNKHLYNMNQKQLLHPASNMKIITTIAGLEFLDSNFTFNTSVYHTGIIMDSVCYGDLIVVGGFDPDFTTSDLDTLVFSLQLLSKTYRFSI